MKNAKIITINQSLAADLLKILTDEGYQADTATEWGEPHKGMSYQLYITDQSTLPQDEQYLDFVRFSRLIVFLYDNQYTTARSWLNIGAKEIFLYPDELNSFKRYLSELGEIKEGESLPLIKGAISREEGYAAKKIIAFYSGKGGSGKSLIASLVAQGLTTYHKKHTLLIDLNAQFGGQEALFNLEPRRSYIDLQPVIQELSYYHITSVSAQPNDSSLTVLLGPADPDKASLATEELLTRTIRLASRHYDHILLDLPSSLNPQSFTGLKEADHIYYILTPDSLAIRTMKHALTFLERYHLNQSGYLSLILNRVHPKAEITEKDIKRIVDIPIAATVHSNYFPLQPFVNMGRPIFIEKGKKVKVKSFEKDLKKLIEAIAKGELTDGSLSPKLSSKAVGTGTAGS